MFKRSTLGIVAATLAAAGGILASAPSALATSPSPTGTVPQDSRVVRVVEAPYAPVHESVAQFLQKAAEDGKPVPASEAASLTVSAAASGCWYWDDWRRGTNIWGATLWQFNVEPNWCGNGTWITNYAYTNTWGSTNWIGWEYKGVISSSDHWGVGWNVFESTRQGSFCYINFYGCVQNQYPYVDVEVGGGGQIYKG